MKIYLVGGAVRDEIMCIVPKDRDYVVTGSTVEDMLSMGFTQVGKDFPVFLHPETNEEYALARTERSTGNSYMDFEFNVDDVTIEEDLSRRDLTINAIAKDLETGEIIDPFNGVSDIEDEVLRHVSDAFKEDPVRVLRLARFYARYDKFCVATETKEIISEMKREGLLDNINSERIHMEIQKVFESTNSGDFFMCLDYVKALCIIPELNRLRNIDDFQFFSNVFKLKDVDELEDVKDVQKLKTATILNGFEFNVESRIFIKRNIIFAHNLKHLKIDKYIVTYAVNFFDHYKVKTTEHLREIIQITEFLGYIGQNQSLALKMTFPIYVDGYRSLRYLDFSKYKGLSKAEMKEVKRKHIVDYIASRYKIHKNSLL